MKGSYGRFWMKQMYSFIFGILFPLYQTSFFFAACQPQKCLLKASYKGRSFSNQSDMYRSSEEKRIRHPLMRNIISGFTRHAKHSAFSSHIRCWLTLLWATLLQTLFLVSLNSSCQKFFFFIIPTLPRTMVTEIRYMRTHKLLWAKIINIKAYFWWLIKNRASMMENGLNCCFDWWMS